MSDKYYERGSNYNLKIQMQLLDDDHNQKPYGISGSSSTTNYYNLQAGFDPNCSFTGYNINNNFNIINNCFNRDDQAAAAAPMELFSSYYNPSSSSILSRVPSFGVNGLSPTPSEVISSLELGHDHQKVEDHDKADINYDGCNSLARNSSAVSSNSSSEARVSAEDRNSSKSATTKKEINRQSSKLEDEEGGGGEEEEEEESSKKVEPLSKAGKKKGEKKEKEPRVAFMTKSEVDHLEDGYRWRKYGQKAVKNSPYPRSYYRCTTQKCKVKKRVERSYEDPSTVITTYEGQHNHPLPSTLRGHSNHNMAAASSSIFQHSMSLPPPQMAAPRYNFSQLLSTTQMPHHQYLNPISFHTNSSSAATSDGYSQITNHSHHQYHDQSNDYGLLQDILNPMFLQQHP